MSELAVPSIDVVVPVYNAAVLTRRCIDSIVASLGQSIRYIYIQDDASDDETREMLDRLPYKGVHVYHAPQNQGFGRSVNDAVGRSDATYVLILNSDILASEDFLPYLCAALVADPRLAAIIPGGNYYAKFNLNQYPREPGGYILTHRLGGYAFLIRREVFQQMGGFDTIFGRGYYEDVDLGRRLNQSGWRIGMHPDTHIYHKGGGSFGRGWAYLALKRRSRTIYFSRYPNARRNILLLSGNCPLTDFPPDLFNAVENVFREGGNVHWFTPESVPQLMCLHMTHSSGRLSVIARLLLRGWVRGDKRISEIWMLPNLPHPLRTLIVLLGHMRGLKVQLWEWPEATQNRAKDLHSV